MDKTERANAAHFPLGIGGSLLFDSGETSVTVASAAKLSNAAPRNKRARPKTSSRETTAYRALRKFSSQLQTVNMETVFYLFVWALNFSIVGWLISAAFGG